MEAKLLHIPWMVSVLYSSIPLFWFAIHPFADSWRKMHRSPYLLLLPIWAAIIFALAWTTWPWSGVRLYSSPWMWAPAAVLIFSGLRTYAGIRSGFGGHKLSGEAELRPREHAQELVTTGLHARMRHPIYVAHLLNLAGLDDWQRPDGELCSAGGQRALHFSADGLAGRAGTGKTVWAELSRLQDARASGPMAVSEDISMRKRQSIEERA